MSPKLTIPEQRSTPKFVHWLGFGVIIGLYFFLVRPIRVGFVSVLLDYMEPVLLTLKEVGIRNSATTLILSIGTQEVHSLKEFTYGLSFNSFFLFASLGLWALKNFKNSMQTLTLIHMLGWIIATVFFFAGLYVHPNWWVGSDLITVYLIPMASLSWVAIVYAEQKRKSS
jgi:multisubunit Na+/H+ antiporter MnhG subunit